METIKDTVQNIIEDLKIKKKRSATGDPEALFKKSLTKAEVRHIKFNYFKRGIVNINVDSSSWLYHLSLRKEKLLAKLMQRSAAIKDIRFRLGEIR